MKKKVDSKHDKVTRVSRQTEGLWAWLPLRRTKIKEDKGRQVVHSRERRLRLSNLGSTQFGQKQSPTSSTLSERDANIRMPLNNNHNNNTRTKLYTEACAKQNKVKKKKQGRNTSKEARKVDIERNVGEARKKRDSETTRKHAGTKQGTLPHGGSTRERSQQGVEKYTMHLATGVCYNGKLLRRAIFNRGILGLCLPLCVFDMLQ